MDPRIRHAAPAAAVAQVTQRAGPQRHPHGARHGSWKGRIFAHGHARAAPTGSVLTMPARRSAGPSNRKSACFRHARADERENGRSPVRDEERGQGGGGDRGSRDDPGSADGGQERGRSGRRADLERCVLSRAQLEARIAEAKRCFMLVRGAGGDAALVARYVERRIAGVGAPDFNFSAQVDAVAVHRLMGADRLDIDTIAEDVKAILMRAPAPPGRLEQDLPGTEEQRRSARMQLPLLVLNLGLGRTIKQSGQATGRSFAAAAGSAGSPPERPDVV